MITLTVDGKKLKAHEGQSVLDAALEAGIYIPNLCYHPDIPPMGACRLCVVEIEGRRGFPAACVTEAQEGMVVHTDTARVQELRKYNMWLIMSEYPAEPAERSQLARVAEYIGVPELLPDFKPHDRGFERSGDDPLFNRDPNLCILCERCVRMCQDIRKTGVIGLVNRGIQTYVGTSSVVALADAGCKFCLACVEVCPSRSLADKVSFTPEEREKVLLPCNAACPAGIDAALYVQLVGEGRYQDALEIVRETVPFPDVLGRVCFHPCEEACRRGQVNEPISIKALKRFVAERDTGRWREKIKVAPDTGKKVAIVGSGPAGLTAAWFLRLLGHSVTVFEAEEEPGGMMRTCIPSYRLPRQVLDKEIADIEDIGVEIKLESRIDSPDELLKDFDAVFLAIGTSDTTSMRIPGEDNPKVLDGIEVLHAINLGREIELGDTIAVVGGGNVAMDVARCALRVGVEKVTILYRRTRKEMPATDEEIEETLHEGVEASYLTAPTKAEDAGDRLNVECIKMELGEPDASGRRRPVPVEGSEYVLEVDKLIMAIGQRSKVPESFGLETDKWGNIAADPETLATGKKGIFAGGDVVKGPSSVIEAIAHGRTAASSIDSFLGGEGKIGQKLVEDEPYKACLGREERFAYRERAVADSLPVEDRVDNFREVECVLSEEAAVAEGERCLRCQLRLKIARAPFPPEK
ncbi:FAD-dependent oxidoreductase [candidate division WOR-3 bacterium]|nr:FAD-dependent oxidoreductase [candidate division WOR-3 bacterium]